MIPKLPIYAKGDSIGIAVYPTGVSLEEVEIDMLVYTTGNGPRITDRRKAASCRSSKEQIGLCSISHPRKPENSMRVSQRSKRPIL